MDRPDVELCRLDPEDWAELSAVRLAALEDAPYAFWSATGNEASWGEQDWRATFENGTWLVARSRGETVGVAKSARGSDDGPDTRHIESVWVAKEFRDQKVARSLLTWLIDHETKALVRQIKIWVIGPNEIAHALYAGLGFRPTGERKPLPSAGSGFSERHEERLLLPIPQPILS